MTNFVGSIVRVIRGWFDPPYKTCVAEGEPPKSLKPRSVYIVQEDGFEEQVVMLCPCRCGKVLHMNLVPDERPCWRVTRHSNGTATLFPSVWRKKDCGSHFWFRQGRVVWCKPEDERAQTASAHTPLI